MTCMRVWNSSNFSLIGPPTGQLAAFERLKKIPIGLYIILFFSAVLDQILFMLAGNDNIHESLDEFEIWSDLIRNHRVSCS